MRSSVIELPATITDALVLASLIERTVCTGYTIVRAPRKPDFWFANCLVLDREPAPAAYDGWLAVHARAFAGMPVQRRILVWETTDKPDVRHKGGPNELERSTVFAARRPPPYQPTGAVIREFDRSADWNAARAMVCDEQREGDQEGGGADSERVAFAAWRFELCRTDAGAGKCRIWGAFEDAVLVAFAGVYASGAYARFITPITKPADRGRGLFRSLCHVAISETLVTHPDALIVIVAKTGDGPERVYERLGYEPIGYQCALVAASGSESGSHEDAAPSGFPST